MNIPAWLCGSVATLAIVVGAEAADLPARKAAPVQYVKICDAYGAGFFYIPGTDTCLRIGGLVQADWAVSTTPDRYSTSTSAYAIAPYLSPLPGVGGPGFIPGVTARNFVPSRSRDAVANQALGRLELDSRTQSPWGTVRAFMRIDSYFGSGATANTGAIPNSIAGLPSSFGTSAARETTILNKAFIQFAGLSMGRIQSFFDFYADNVGFTSQPGSVGTVNAIAYTYAFGGGFSASLAVEDEVSHRAESAVLVTALPGTGLPAPTDQFNGTRMPDLVANLRVDQPWGSAQISGALHGENRSIWSTTPWLVAGAPLTQPVFPVASTGSLGFALAAGVRFNLDMLAPGDVLWLQATYAKGAVGYVSGNNLNFNNGVDFSTSYGVGLGRISSGNGWSGQRDYDCVWTYSGSCDKSTAWAVVGALRHYWTPTISSTLTASYYSVSYSAAALNPVPGAVAAGAATAGLGMTNFRQTILATGLEWNPVRNFGIATEFAWTHGVVSRPTGLAYDWTLAANGVAFHSNNDLVRGRVRMYRAF
jgi:hypothetical protein